VLYTIAKDIQRRISVWFVCDSSPRGIDALNKMQVVDVDLLNCNAMWTCMKIPAFRKKHTFSIFGHTSTLKIEAIGSMWLEAYHDDEGGTFFRNVD
jgi:hypothetical protein